MFLGHVIHPHYLHKKLKRKGKNCTVKSMQFVCLSEEYEHKNDSSTKTKESLLKAGMWTYNIDRSDKDCIFWHIPNQQCLLIKHLKHIKIRELRSSIYFQGRIRIRIKFPKTHAQIK